MRVIIFRVIMNKYWSLIPLLSGNWKLMLIWYTHYYCYVKRVSVDYVLFSIFGNICSTMFAISCLLLDELFSTTRCMIPFFFVICSGDRFSCILDQKQDDFNKFHINRETSHVSTKSSTSRATKFCKWFIWRSCSEHWEAYGFWGLFSFA